jgi:hypothetical protein
VVHGYPLDARAEGMEQGLYMGPAPVFRKPGFVEVVRYQGDRPVMRYTIEPRAV